MRPSLVKKLKEPNHVPQIQSFRRAYLKFAGKQLHHLGENLDSDDCQLEKLFVSKYTTIVTGLVVTSIMLPVLSSVILLASLAFSTIHTISIQRSLSTDPYIVQLCQESRKIFNVLADAQHSFYDPKDYILGTSYFSKNVYSRQSYVSNGYIGSRISTLGQGFSYDEINTHTGLLKSEEILENGWPLFNKRYTGAFIAGFYSLQETLPETNFPELYRNGYDSVISSVPYWAGFELILEKEGRIYYFNPEVTTQDEISHYHQTTSLRNGVVSTTLTWLGEIEIKIDVLAHKQILPLGLLSFELTALHSNLTLVVRDTLNITTSQRTDLKNIGFDDDGIFIEVYPNNVDYSAAAIYSSMNYSWKPRSYIAGGTVVLEDEISLQVNETRTIRKYVGVVSSEFKKNSFGSELKHAKDIVSFAKMKGFKELYEAHDSEWRSQFEETDIHFPSNELLTISARASLYHLLANTQVNSHGLTSALGAVGLSSDSYGGMVFWDTDIWIIPGIVPFAPKVAKAVADYRNFTHAQAVDNAKSYNYHGAAYPWTSGRFGNCTSSGPCFDYEYHINIDIALSSWLLYLSGEDDNYLRYTTWPLLRDASDFLSEFTTFDDSLGKFVTQNLTDPDEYANHINNGAFTNGGIDALLKVTLLVAKHLNQNINPRWVDVKDDIYIPVSKHGITLEYSGMNASVSIKQADVVLLSFPLNFGTSPQYKDQAIQDLFYYSLKQADVGPAMTFPIFTVVAARLLDYGCSSQSYLQKSVIPYYRTPYAQFSEQADDNILTNGGTHPAFPFLTAHGGFLQAIVYGILGIKYSARLDPDSGKIVRYLEFDPVRSYALPGGVKISGIKYMNQLLDISVTDNEGIIFHKGTESIVVEVNHRNKKAGSYRVHPGQIFRVPVFIPSLNMQDSINECGTIANLTAGSPGEVSLSAVDGNNYTYWQPMSRDPARLLIDLGFEQSISRGVAIWGSRPPKKLSLYVLEGAGFTFKDVLLDVDKMNFTKVIDDLPVDISEPFDETYLKEVKLLPNNETYFELDGGGSVVARFVIFETVDAHDLSEPEGATINEIALFN